MPKGSKRDGAAWKADGEFYSNTTNRRKVARKGREAARTIVGDQNLKLIDEGGPFTESVSVKSSENKAKADKAAAAYNRKVKVDKAKARTLKAGKARIKDDSDIVDMVRKKKSTNRNDYGA